MRSAETHLQFASPCANTDAMTQTLIPPERLRELRAACEYRGVDLRVNRRVAGPAGPP